MPEVTKGPACGTGATVGYPSPATGVRIALHSVPAEALAKAGPRSPLHYPVYFAALGAGFMLVE
ncbi:hypothetical protein HZA57_05295, partial [Candidatus Poribacteria bacterium]|nr:hypothetical protein [Candidatus Poribacteria bacterium]